MRKFAEKTSFSSAIAFSFAAGLISRRRRLLLNSDRNTLGHTNTAFQNQSSVQMKGHMTSVQTSNFHRLARKARGGSTGPVGASRKFSKAEKRSQRMRLGASRRRVHDDVLRLDVSFFFVNRHTEGLLLCFCFSNQWSVYYFLSMNISRALRSAGR
jgi:hypothetical protein